MKIELPILQHPSKSHIPFGPHDSPSRWETDKTPCWFCCSGKGNRLMELAKNVLCVIWEVNLQTHIHSLSYLEYALPSAPSQPSSSAWHGYEIYHPIWSVIGALQLLLPSFCLLRHKRELTSTNVNVKGPPIFRTRSLSW